MPNEMCEEMLNLNAMHHAVMRSLFGRTEFVDEDDAKVFFDVGCQFLSSILFAKYQRNRECHLKLEAR